MDEQDLKAIENLLGKKLDEKFDQELSPIRKDLVSVKKYVEEVKETLDSHTASIMKIEQKLDSALDLRQDVAEIRDQVKNHEERISSLETV